MRPSSPTDLPEFRQKKKGALITWKTRQGCEPANSPRNDGPTQCVPHKAVRGHNGLARRKSLQLRRHATIPIWFAEGILRTQVARKGLLLLRLAGAPEGLPLDDRCGTKAPSSGGRNCTEAVEATSVNMVRDVIKKRKRSLTRRPCSQDCSIEGHEGARISWMMSAHR